MSSQQPQNDIRHGVVVNGSGNVVQNVTGNNSSATNSAAPLTPEQQAVVDSLAQVRAVLATAQLPAAERAECDDAVQDIEAGVADLDKHRLSIKRALRVLAEAATTVGGLALAVSALQRGLGHLGI